MPAPRRAAETEPAPLGKVLEFMRTLWALDHALQSSSKRMKKRFGVTGMQRLVIRIVGRYPGSSLGSVSEILHVHPSTLTGVVDKLVARGALERGVDPDDARRVRLHLTESGAEIDAIKTGTIEAAVKRSLGQMSAAEIAALRRAIEVITANLEGS